MAEIIFGIDHGNGNMKGENVCFPCATIHDSETGKIALYYGAADSYVGVAFTTLDEIVDYIKDHSLVREEDTELGIR